MSRVVAFVGRCTRVYLPDLGHTPPRTSQIEDIPITPGAKIYWLIRRKRENTHRALTNTILLSLPARELAS